MSKVLIKTLQQKTFEIEIEHSETVRFPCYIIFTLILFLVTILKSVLSASITGQPFTFLSDTLVVLKPPFATSNYQTPNGVLLVFLFRSEL